MVKPHFCYSYDFEERIVTEKHHIERDDFRDRANFNQLL
ncbi:hypothetical protein GWL_06750 [Herbaspirillum sp. GW103]|nr:hypothetical protein GWL_06750 [Herbaspirillum sp. GW103]